MRRHPGPAVAMTFLLLISAKGVSAMERFGAWLVPWDVAESSSALECFEELNPFAFALSPASAPILAYPELLESASAYRGGKALILPVVVNDVFADGKLQTLKSDGVLSGLLSDPRACAGHIDELVRIAREFDGIEIDYERVPSALWDRFADFVERLGRELHGSGRRLALDLEPGFFRDPDLARRLGPRLARSADEIKLMAYYERGGLALRPGPGSSLPWMVETARRALEVIPREKLTVALSLAGTDWTPSLPGGTAPWRGSRLHYGRVMKLLSETRAEVRRDGPSADPRFRVSLNGLRHEVWFEDEKSLEGKMDALREIGVVKFSFWYWGKKRPALRLCE